MDEESSYWIIPIIAFVSAGLFLGIAVNERMNTPERYIEPEVIVEKTSTSTGLNPYVEFCNPNDDFFPIKDISNSTHKFNHKDCIWDMR
jgi:hypothetical protein